MRTRLAALILGLITLPAMTQANPSDGNAPADDSQLVLTISHGEESTRVSLREIEQLALHEIDMHHPEGLQGTFTAVLMNELVDAYGLHEARRIRLVAADDYTTFLTPAEREEKEYMLVTRFEGEPIPFEKQGPLMLVVPDDADAVRAGALPMTKWIWSVIEIRAR